MDFLSILLVEDEDPKREHIRRFLSKRFLGVRVFEVRSVTSAFDAIEKSKFDLLLLDMSLPTFDVGQGETGGRPQGFGGLEILRHLEMEGEQIDSLVLTGYEAFPDDTGKMIDLQTLRQRLMGEFPRVVRGVIHYNSSLDDWKQKLGQGVEAAVYRRIEL